MNTSCGATETSCFAGSRAGGGSELRPARVRARHRTAVPLHHPLQDPLIQNSLWSRLERLDAEVPMFDEERTNRVGISRGSWSASRWTLLVPRPSRSKVYLAHDILKAWVGTEGVGA